MDGLGPEPLIKPVQPDNTAADPKAETLEFLKRPGAKLIMPAEESIDYIEGRPALKESIRGRSSRAPAQKEDHKAGSTFARVYANDIAAPSMKNERGLRFPVGSVIVREKLWREDSTEPALITAMFKRERGFSPRTNDWEFFVIDRRISRIKDRDTVGSCAACHVNAKETDWVYKSYLP